MAEIETSNNFCCCYTNDSLFQVLSGRQVTQLQKNHEIHFAVTEVQVQGLTHCFPSLLSVPGAAFAYLKIVPGVIIC